MTTRAATDPVARHVARMRLLTIVALAFAAAAAVAGFALPRSSAALLPPAAVTALVVAAALWVAFTAERDARSRLERIKRAYAVEGDRERLLRGYLGVYGVVLVRLSTIVIAGLVVAVAGLGPAAGLATQILAGALIALTWPTRHKALLLIDRAERMRGPGGSA